MESEQNKSTPPENIAEVNQDELIIAQQRQIDKEVADTTPLVGEKLELSALAAEYTEDPIYLQKIEDLRTKYKYIRRTRGDGNCFFRAFAFNYLETLLEDKEEYLRFKELIEKSLKELETLGFKSVAVEDFYSALMDVLDGVDNNISREDLLGVFNDEGVSNYVVVYMRLLTSYYIQKDADLYSNFIEGNRTVKEFCSQEVEPMSRECDHIHIIALATGLKVGIRVQYMDRGAGNNVTAHDFPEEQTPRVHLLYRPGHYDILYES